MAKGVTYPQSCHSGNHVLNNNEVLKNTRIITVVIMHEGKSVFRFYISGESFRQDPSRAAGLAYPDLKKKIAAS